MLHTKKKFRKKLFFFAHRCDGGFRGRGGRGTRGGARRAGVWDSPSPGGAARGGPGPSLKKCIFRRIRRPLKRWWGVQGVGCFCNFWPRRSPRGKFFEIFLPAGNFFFREFFFFSRIFFFRNFFFPENKFYKFVNAKKFL